MPASSKAVTLATELFSPIDELAEVSNQAKELRKAKKAAEHELLEILVSRGVPELDVDGRTIVVGNTLSVGRK